MKETLHIKNFGPIKEVKLELGKVNVFIGDQGTGKSTIAKLFNCLKNFIHYKIFNNTKPDDEMSIQWQFENLVKLFELDSYFNNDTELYFKDEFAIVRFNNNLVTKENIKQINSLTYDSKNRNELNEFLWEKPILPFIVAERVQISLLSDALFGLNELGTKLPPLFNRFGNKFNSYRKEFNGKYSHLLGVDFKQINGIDSVILKNGKILPMILASSGIQGTVPLLVVFDKITSNNIPYGRMRKLKKESIVIEEPELNLFPNTQQKLIKHIIGENFYIPKVTIPDNINLDNNINPTSIIEEDFDNKEFKSQLLLTTHSPYILTSLNNLMYAYSVGQKNKKEVSSVIEEKYWLNPEDVSAYMLEYDEKQGGIVEKNILDKESGLIDSVQIDGVSDVLSDEFNKIMAIKLNV